MLRSIALVLVVGVMALYALWLLVSVVSGLLHAVAAGLAVAGG